MDNFKMEKVFDEIKEEPRYPESPIEEEHDSCSGCSGESTPSEEHDSVFYHSFTPGTPNQVVFIKAGRHGGSISEKMGRELTMWELLEQKKERAVFSPLFKHRRRQQKLKKLIKQQKNIILPTLLSELSLK